MTTAISSATRHEIAAWIISGCALLLILHLHLLLALLAGLLVHQLTHLMVPFIRRRVSGDRAKLVSVFLLVTLIVGAIVAAGFGIAAFFRSDAGSLAALLGKMAEILENSRASLPAWLVEHMPENTEALKHGIVGWLRSHTGELQLFGKEAARGFAHILIGLVIGAMLALYEVQPIADYRPLARALIERCTRLAEAFRRIVFAQVRISAVNTAFTAIYLAVVLPLLGVHLPLTKTMIAVTFFAGLLPVIGNLISNTIIVGRAPEQPEEPRPRHPTGELIVVTGVSGSGKSSLVFDTLYAEGQRRYVETFSPYARQFLDRMDKPQVDRIEGIPPAIAIDQTNPVRTSRSTVGTMTELNDHLKLLYARAGAGFTAAAAASRCGATRRSIIHAISPLRAARRRPAPDHRFPVTVPRTSARPRCAQLLARRATRASTPRQGPAAGPCSTWCRTASAPRRRRRARALVEALEAALRVGQGRRHVHARRKRARRRRRRHLALLHRPALRRLRHPLRRADAEPVLVQLAARRLRGLPRLRPRHRRRLRPGDAGRIEDARRRRDQALADASYKECQDDLLRSRRSAAWLDIAVARPAAGAPALGARGRPGVRSEALLAAHWYGVKRFFDWLETKAYKMHIRVLLSRYRAYTPCAACGGARLKPERCAGARATRARGGVAPATALRPRCRPAEVRPAGDETAADPAGPIHDLMLLPIERCRRRSSTRSHLPAPLDEATDLLLGEIRARLAYLCEVGLGYLTLDRQSRTLSGGEVQRINLTTALGTSLVNTLFVLDEPSIGLHPRDMGRVIGVMHRLRDAGNSLVVVEHDPQIMFEADRMLDMGPGPGERGGEIVFFGTPARMRARRR
jgi:predicted PurR-regulated permease PerM